MFANDITARLGAMNDGKVIVRGFDPNRTLADFMQSYGVSQSEIHEIRWLQERSIGVQFKEQSRAESFVREISKPRRW